MNDPLKTMLDSHEPPPKAGSCLLADPTAAAVVQNALLHFEGTRYFLLSWCVTPNHVHVLVAPRPPHTLSAILHSWKSFTSNRVNEALGRSGTLWQHESFDHYVRNDDELRRIARYVEHNPVVAGLCSAAHEWPFGSAHAPFQVSREFRFVPGTATPRAELMERGKLLHIIRESCTYFVTWSMFDAHGRPT
jgi:REP element-mobilizing transposase RayT